MRHPVHVQPRRHARGRRERRPDRAGVGRGDRRAAGAARSRLGTGEERRIQPDGARVVHREGRLDRAVWDTASGKPVGFPAHASRRSGEFT
jgi:hypothetical protein